MVGGCDLYGGSKPLAGLVVVSMKRQQSTGRGGDQCVTGAIMQRRVGELASVVDRAVAAMIRTGKMHQVPSVMQTSTGKGMQLLNTELARLVKEGVIDRSEGVRCAVDKVELTKLLPPVA